MVAAHVRSVRFRWRALNIRRSGGTGRRAELKPPNTLGVRLPPSAFMAGIEQGWLDGLISHNRQVQLLPPLSGCLNFHVLVVLAHHTLKGLAALSVNGVSVLANGATG